MSEVLLWVVKIYLALGLATFIHFVWCFKWELMAMHVQHPVASFIADFTACVRCVLFWPKIQYLNFFGEDKE